MFPSDVRLWFDWHLTNRCNFFCDYCHPQIRYVLNKRHLDEPSPETCAAAFDALGLTCGILMSGGEPFAFPGYIELCERLTRRHYIAMNTNLSMTTGIAEFCAAIPSRKVSRILAAVHVAERVRNGLDLENYAANFRQLREAGYPIYGAYVLHPELLDRAEADFAQLRALGVDRLAGKVFKGIWQKRRFPTGYNDAELAVVRRLIAEYHVGAAYLDHDWDFRGLSCQSGVTSFKVGITGEVQRCVSVPGSLGNLYAGTFQPTSVARPCTAKHVRVLSECVEHLREKPAELVTLLASAADEAALADD